VHLQSIPNDLRPEDIPPGGIKFLFSSLAVVGAHEDAETRFRKRRFALSKTGSD
jgi:hypothetical protein